jgi:PKD repeat protein
VCGTNFTSTCTEYIWGKTGYSSLASFQAATGQEAHGKEADPLFMARDNGDFRLQAGSPAIDDANSAVAGWQATDYAANLRVDDPTTPNTGVGPRSYDDRGALEYQPTQSGSPPTASLAVTPSSGIAPLAVTADASASTAGSAAIATYAFDFGDGSAVVGPQSGANTGHTYGSAGTYTAKVTVTDAAGQSSTATSQVAVTSSSPPNLVGNPGFETNTAGWNTSGSGSTVTLTRVSGGHSGGWSAALANTGTVSGTCALNDSPNWVTATAAGTYTGSLWVRADMPGAPLTLRFREYQGSTLVGSKTATVTLTTTWQQIQVTYMPLAPGLSTLDFNAYVPAAFAPPGSCFYADDAAITTG